MRAFWAASKPELAALYRKHKGLQEAWEALKANNTFDRRGMVRAVFILGWLACEQYHARRLEVMADRIAAASTEAAQSEKRQYLRGAAIAEIDADILRGKA